MLRPSSGSIHRSKARYMPTVTYESIRDLIMERLASGVYPVGAKLPASRDLANEVGAHRNTVAKAYQALADMGLVRPRPGRGTYVTALVGRNNSQALLPLVRAHCTELVTKARRLGLREQELRSILDEEIAATFCPQPMQAAFVECNREDSMGAVAEIEVATGFQIKPLLLTDLAANPESVGKAYDVVFTSLFHINEVHEILSTVAPELRVVGLYTQPDEDALRAIARIDRNARVGVIASNVDGAARFVALVNTYGAANTAVRLSPNKEEIEMLAAEVDVIVSSRSQAVQTRQQSLTIPIIELPFHVTQPSIALITDVLTTRTPVAE